MSPPTFPLSPDCFGYSEPLPVSFPGTFVAGVNKTNCVVFFFFFYYTFYLVPAGVWRITECPMFVLYTVSSFTEFPY